MLKHKSFRNTIRPSCRYLNLEISSRLHSHSLLDIVGDNVDGSLPDNAREEIEHENIFKLIFLGVRFCVSSHPQNSYRMLYNPIRLK